MCTPQHTKRVLITVITTSFHKQNCKGTVVNCMTTNLMEMNVQFEIR
jgi:hypothetical protein